MEGVAHILNLKNRSWEQGLLLVAADIEQFSGYLSGLGETQLSELRATWPGPTTYLVPDNGTAPRWIVGEHETVGLRVSAHPLVQSLCQKVGPIVSTSANASGRPAALSAMQVRRYFRNSIDYLVPGSLGGATGPSQIKLLETGEVIR
jgi:L-threonylcarbamoyladenylate synthase